MEAIQFNPEGVRPLAGLSQGPAGRPEGAAADFGETFKNYLNEVNTLQNQADQTVRDLAAGKLDNMHEVLLAVNEADLSFRLMMQVRNKLLDAYREIMRMQV